jgi:1,4-dihydroxy-2-naphthoate octaprenyltransferase
MPSTSARWAAGGRTRSASRGWPILAIGVGSILAAVGYTAGPFPLGYIGLGEVASFGFFGPVAVAGTYYVQAGFVHPLAWALSAPIGFWVAAIIVVNNLRDAPTDAKVGKRTLAVRFGTNFARGLYVGLLTAGFLLPVVLAFEGIGLAGFLPLLALPLAIAPLRAVLGPPEGPALNEALAATGKLLLAGGSLLAGGLVLVGA